MNFFRNAWDRLQSRWSSTQNDMDEWPSFDGIFVDPMYVQGIRAICREEIAKAKNDDLQSF